MERTKHDSHLCSALINGLWFLIDVNGSVEGRAAIALIIQFEHVHKRVLKSSRAVLALEARLHRTFQCRLLEHRMATNYFGRA
ncbi:MAG TPA: hypothetical protein VKW78_09310 [Terriglobales bacterium]|nr:hypothetical protein [Terriglobales bacterium]